MGRRSRELQEINAGSMADIAFLLLIFFLVTTTMDTDTGLTRVLPPYIDEQTQEPPPPVNARNVFVVLANANDNMLVEDEYMQIEDLKDAAKEFIIGRPNDLTNEKYPDFKKVEDPDLIKYFGANQMISKQIISLQNDRGTSYDLYVQIQDQLASAYREARDEMSMEKFGVSYTELSKSDKEEDKEKAQAIKALIPQRISEAEPKDIDQARIAAGRSN
jgi:biopolymer transport protein ExbD